MKKKINALMAVIVVATLTLLNACDKRDNSMGIDYIPEYSKYKALNQDFLIDYATVSADMSKEHGGNTPINGTSYNNIYVSSSFGYLGTIPNQEFGSVTCEYLTQFKCPDGFQFTLSPIDNKIDSAFISVYYNGISGDPIAPMQVSAYKLTKSLPFDKYSISDISQYTAQSELLGSTSFIAKKGSYSGKKDIQVIKIPLSQKLAQEIYDFSASGSAHFSNQASFDKYFPGVYLTASAGMGSVVRVYGTALTFYFQVKEQVKDKETNTTKEVVVTKSQELVHTSEVPQLSRFSHQDLEKLISKASTDKDFAYIKAPAGVLTEITIPTRKIQELLSSAPKGYERILNSVQFAILGENQFQSEEDLKSEENTYALPAPADLLLLPSDSVSTFFSRELTDLQRPYTAFVSEKSISSSLSYDFGNISSVILKHIENSENKDKDLKLWVVPIDRTVGMTPQGTQGSSNISNLTLPSAMKIKSDQKNKTIKVFIIERKVGAPF